VTIRFDNSAIDFTAAGNPYHLVVPNAEITFSPTATLATTAFNTATNTWETTLPSSGLAGNDWLTGLAFQVPVDLPGGINPVTWSGTFSSDTTGLTIHWQWAAAIYTVFSTDYNLLGVKPVDDNMASIYLNSDHAGTPENYKTFVIGGARGGGGSNFTGSYSGTGSVSCP
jgi:beta-glucanase (GH16 family)